MLGYEMCRVPYIRPHVLSCPSQTRARYAENYPRKEIERGVSGERP